VAKRQNPDSVELTELKPDPQNRRLHNARNLDMIAASLKSVGAARSIVLDENNQILAGNGVHEAAPAAGISRVRIIDADGDELIAVRRHGLTADQKRELAIFDNRAGELSEWNEEQLESDKAAGLSMQPFWTPEEEAAMASHAAAREIDGMARQSAATEPATEEPSGDDPHTFFCPLTTDQERVVRAALRLARTFYHVDTTGEALTAALQAWADQCRNADAPNV
jgi:hypothetical protein